MCSPTKLDFGECPPLGKGYVDSGECPPVGKGYVESSSDDEHDISRDDPEFRRRLEEFKRKLKARMERHKGRDPKGKDVTQEASIENCEGNGRNPTTRATISTILGKRNNENIADTVYLSSDGGTDDLPGSDESEEDNDVEERMPVEQQRREKYVLAKLSDEHIKTTSRKYCCKGHCLLTLGTTGIREVRETYFQKKSQDQSSSLQWLMQQSGDDCGGSRITYLVRSSKVCQRAFKEVFYVGNNRLACIIQLGNRDVAYRDDRSGRKETPRELVIVSWLKEFFKTRVESLPNKTILHLPDNYTKYEVWKLFHSTFATRDETVKIDYNQFTKIWRFHFPNVKIPPVSRFSACADCEEFKTMRDKAITDAEKQAGNKMLSLHREQQHQERVKLAKHRKKCFSDPEKYMGIVIDGMDQKKTRLPHWPRTPKSMDESCLLQMHVVGCLVFHKELHSRVFLNYPNLHNDGNLTITILQRVLNEWEEREGGLPPVLYIQLDNTSRENKNNLLMTYLHMLVRKNIFKKIKIGFLLVGHTHDQIDQMFSRFSKRLGKHKAFTFEELRIIIAEAYTPEPLITLLTETFDFRKYAFSEPSFIVQSIRNIKFQHQYKISFDKDDDTVPTQWGKKFSTDVEWKPEEGVKLLKDGVLEKVMYASRGIPLSRKGDKKIGETKDKVYTVNEMEESLAEIEQRGVLAGKSLFEEHHIQWWSSFFEEQREFNRLLHLEDRPLKYAFKWPTTQREEGEHATQEEHQVSFTEAQINERVYGARRDIYIGPYRNQKVIDLEKENMEGDMSDLNENTFISIVGEEIESEGKFWVAKVEKILKRDEKNVPKEISVLWHAVKGGQDPWKGRYWPEVKGYEKKKGRGKGTQKPIWFHQDLDLEETTVFSYNFYLTKNDTLYKKTVDRIKIRMAEYIEDRKCENERIIIDLSLAKD